jgi:hypothetical protein
MLLGCNGSAQINAHQILVGVRRIHPLLYSAVGD